jgi:LmbE family N-acetylglucosaminyl deacetylase
MSVLVIAPHMDDEVLGCGGVLQRFDKPNVLFCTFSREDWRLSADGKHVGYSGTTRVREMQAARDLLDYDPLFLNLETHGLDRLAVGALVQQISRKMPNDVELLLVPGWSHDQDHNAVRKAVEVLMRPHNYAGSVLEYWTWGSPTPYEPQVVVPLTSDEVATKMKALSRYKTQLDPGGSLYAYSVDSVYSYMASNGRIANENYAEVFTPRRLVPNKTTARFFDDRG